MNIIKLIVGLLLWVCLTSCAVQGYSTNGKSLSSASDKVLVDDAVSQTKKLSSFLYAEEAKVELKLILAELLRRHPEWMWNKIDSNRADKGMSKSEMLLAWGKPYSTNKEKNYWIYKLQGTKRKVKFSGDKVTGIIDIKVNNVRSVFH
jgi:hypothetical protein